MLISKDDVMEILRSLYNEAESNSEQFRIWKAYEDIQDLETYREVKECLS